MLKIGDLIEIKGVKYRILRKDGMNFCLNNLEAGGFICHVAWKYAYLENTFAE